MTSTDLTVPADHPAFDGHFPGHPLWPGALLLDAVMARLPGMPRPVRFTQVKFRREVTPAARLQIRLEPQDDDGFRFAIDDDRGLVADGRVRCT